MRAAGPLGQRLRLSDWFDYKIPPLLTLCYALMLLGPVAIAPAIGLLAVAIGPVLLAACYGYLCNDAFDVIADRAAGRPNAQDRLPWSARAAWLLVALAALALTQVVLDPGWQAAAGMAGLVALVTAYCAPPVRLKERGWLGVAADAGSAHVLPTVYVGLVAWHRWPVWPGAATALLLTTAALYGCAGLRGIILHQVHDRAVDRQAGTRTFVQTRSTRGLRRLVLRRLLPIEAGSLLAFVMIVAWSDPLLLPLAAAWGGVELGKMRGGWRLPLFYPARRGERYLPLLNNEVYQVVLPVALLVLLSVRTPAFAMVLVAHCLLFQRTVREAIVNAVLALRGVRRRAAATTKAGPMVIVGAPAWVLNGVTIFSANLCRELSRLGIANHVLVTEAATPLVQHLEAPLPTPADVALVSLAVPHGGSWGAQWGSMLHYLEDRAPCLYLPNSDWRHSCVVPLLSDQVGVIGVLHSDDPLHYDHLVRLGSYWNRIVCVSDQVARRALACRPDLADRLVVIPIGVDVPEVAPPRHAPAAGAALRVIYHGTLKQHQKRVLDLPRIVAAAAAAGIPMRLTIAGGGPDADALQAAAAPYVARGRIEFLGVVPHADVLGLLERHDVFLLVSEFEGMPNALLEAMARGCVPVVTGVDSAVPELVGDACGFVVPVGDIAAVVERLAVLHREPALLRQMGVAARARILAGPYSTRQMAARYASLFEDVAAEIRAGRWRRPSGEMSLPPAEVDGVGLFPVPLTYHAPGVGWFPNRFRDWRDFVRARAGARPAEARPPGQLAVIATVPAWEWTGVNRFAADLTRGLRAAGAPARLVLTEAATDRVPSPPPCMPEPNDITLEHLAVARSGSWGAHWGAMLRLLSGPCVFVPHHDWRHSCVVPLLPPEVTVVGIVHGTDALHLDHVRRLGAFWDVVVVTNEAIGRRVLEVAPEVADRLALLPHPVDLPAAFVRGAASGPPRIGVLGPVRMADAGWLSALAAAGSVLVLEIAACPADALRSLPGVGFAGAVSQDGLRAAFTGLDAVCVREAWEGTVATLMEAMGRGCIPLVAAGVAAEDWELARVLRAGVTGFVPGDDAAWSAALLVCSDPARRLALQRAAFAAVQGSYGLADAAADLLALVAEARASVASGRWRRPMGEMSLPPAEVDGVGLFPVPLTYHAPGVGWFPNRFRDWRDFVRARAGEPPVEGQLAVIATIPAWEWTGVNRYAADLTRGLRAAGAPARLVLTEAATDRVPSPPPCMPAPNDITLEHLAVARSGSWGAHWGAMLRLLSGPCVFVPHHDWRHSCVVPLLPPEVTVVGIVHGTDALHLDHLRRLGAFWDVVVVTNEAIGRRVLEVAPGVADRLALLPHPVDLPAAFVRGAASGPPRIGVLGPVRLADAGWLSALAAAGSVVVLEIAACPADALRSLPGVVFAGAVSQDGLRAAFTGLDAVCVREAWEGTVATLMEAMGRGCIPLVAAGVAAEDWELARVLRAGVTGFVPGDDAAWSAALLVCSDPARRLALQRAAFAAVQGSYGLADAAADLLALVAEARASVASGRWRRPSGEMSLPPAEVDGVGLFPVPLTYHAPGVGWFPANAPDAMEFAAATAPTRRSWRDRLRWR